MTQQIYANNAKGRLNSGINATALALTLGSGEGALFPSPVASEYFLVTLFVNGPTGEEDHEVIRVTDRAGDTLTIVRAQEGTMGRVWSSTTAVEVRVTKGTLDELKVTATTVATAGGVVDTDFVSNGLLKRTALGSYSIITDNSGNWNAAFGWGNHAGLYSMLSHTHAAGDITTGTFALARISQSAVTQHEGALAIAESQISDLQTYLTDNGLNITDNSSGNWLTVNSSNKAIFDGDMVVSGSTFTWSTDTRQVELGPHSALASWDVAGATPQTWLAHNAYMDSSDTWRTKIAGFASLMDMTHGGDYYLYTVATTLAQGAVITWVPAMILRTDGSIELSGKVTSKGERLDSSLSIKTTNTTRTNTQTPVYDTDFAFGPMVGGKVYEIEMMLIVGPSSSSGNGDLKWILGLVGGSATGSLGGTRSVIGTSGSTQIELIELSVNETNTVDIPTFGTSYISVKGLIKCDSSVTILEFRWAQNISNAIGTVMYEGSYARIKEIGWFV